MQEDSNNRNTRIAPVRHRLRRRGGRGLLVGAVALVAVGVTGVSAATLSRHDAPEPAAVSLDAQARAEAAARADRSTRESAAPASPSATTAPSPTATTASPSPRPTRTASTKPRTEPKPRTTARPAAKRTVKPKPSWVAPMRGAEITSCYGQRWGTLHAGIDFAMPAGTPIHAAAAGTVVKAGDAGDGYGNSVFIDHGNGYLTHYAHQSSLEVSVGDKVAAGEVIGYEGATGDATGPHLHFEVHQGQMWNQIDPAPFLRARGIDVAC
ncbi:M23 family metallopeptidase [Micromonospora mirobrigensis]|uniref:Murein DD-endopeptidase MepM and murein hydrolase activator NlpD, contain LysM domain n=1 Tax=Micromonospora mirobrigensis TaxID=262898 RepID=A0A1C4Y131_9ACTN|nr:M23 family metallopeptidase [Micromonospora mirobrigensis]SCF14435.1 Murein DD-endopeptidase MepM and murein hydrolase activator NlpD, contain LysM domain [Micromonospora mirobrigensis]